MGTPYIFRIIRYSICLFAAWQLTGLFFPAIAYSQSPEVCIQGKVGDKDANLSFAGMILLKDELFYSGTESDLKGNFTFHDVSPGVYRIAVIWGGLVQGKTDPILVLPAANPILDIVLDNIILPPAASPTQAGAAIPDSLLDFSPGQKITLSLSQIREGANRNIFDLLARGAACHQFTEQTVPGIKGAGAHQTAVQVDGVTVNGPAGIPFSSIRSARMLTGGIPAEYGGFSGGILLIQTQPGIHDRNP